MRIHETLKRLASRAPSPWPVLSVYVNTRPVGTAMTTYRPFLKKHLAEEIRALKPRSPEHESLAVDAARVQHYLDYDLKEFTRATAVFACYGDGDNFDAVQIPVEFPEQLVTVGPLATLYPLLRVADRYRRAAVLVSDTHQARLFTIALGSIEVRREVRHPALHKPKSAGEADPANLQRHVEESWHKHARQAVQALEELVTETHASWILIGGDEPMRPELEAALSPAARERLLGHYSWDVRIPETELAQIVEREVAKRESALRKARAEEIVANAPHEGAILGVETTVEALRTARVLELYLSDAFPADAQGWACRACRTFGAGPPDATCPACTRPELQIVSLREEMGAQALAQGAAVHFVEAPAVPAFEAKGGVGAIARYN